MPITKPRKFSTQNNGKYADLLSLGQFKQGMINRVNEYSLPNDALLDALNMDIDNDGKVKTRKKYKMFDTGNFHSLWSDKLRTFVVKNGNLSVINDSFSVQSIANNFSHNKQVYYVEFLNEIYISNGEKTLKYNRLNNTDAWTIRSPQVEPEVSASSQGTGSMKKGRYLISHTYMLGNFETSGSPYAVLEVPYDDFFINVSTLPTGNSDNACWYVSQVNGEELFKAKYGYSTEIDRLDNYGIPLDDNLLDGMPPLKYLCKLNSRILGSQKADIVYSEVENPRLYNPAKNRIYIDETEINMLIGVDEGIYISTQLSTYFLRTRNPSDANSQLVKLFDFNAIEGTNFIDEKNRRVGWLSSQGYMVADQSGKVENLTKDKFDFPKNYKSGAALYKEFDSNKQIIFSLQQKGENTALQSDAYKNKVNNDT